MVDTVLDYPVERKSVPVARADFGPPRGNPPVAVRERSTVRREYPATPEQHTGVAQD